MWALSRRPCRLHARVRLGEARAERQGRTAELIARLDFLILDELGYLPFAQTGGQLLFHLISKLYERTSINLADRLDPAARRRFSVNAETRPLGMAQLGIAFRKFFESEPPAGLFDLEGLTPGDMASVARRCNLLGKQDQTAILDSLRDEAQAKNNGGIRPGFRQSSPKNYGNTKR